MNLNDIKIGNTVKVKKITGGPMTKLLAMGFTKGAPVKVIKKAPLKDPIEFEVRGYRISLRKAEAKYIEVE
ncbi:FeoA family protein [Methanococcus aeolicus]|uniref:FeoA family protein n=1 Tax=Methanococcus aeolicus TaxID=42879 RepID=UPI0021C79F10|nr:ferrous iron transport protein A [Methanococcus aeolicus]UXM85045.1 ferrous iron transport protein A [Methanococcus aeolicus]